MRFARLLPAHKESKSAIGVISSLVLPLLALQTNAFAAWGDTQIAYSPSQHTLSGQSVTAADSEPSWPLHIYWCYPYELGYLCEVREYVQVEVEVTVHGPSFIDSAQASGYYQASAPWAIVAPASGWWHAQAYHSVRWNRYEVPCVVPMEVYCNYQEAQYIGQILVHVNITNASEEIPSSPPPCIHHGTPQSGSLSNDASLPDSGVRYYHYLGGDAPNTDDWSCPGILQEIIDAGIHWIPSPRIGVGNISRQGGGSFNPPHTSHQNGLDLDIRYVKNNGMEGPLDLTVPSDAALYNQQGTQALVNWFCNVAGATLILAHEDAQLTSTTCTILEDAGHSDHFHLRFPDPDGTSN